MPAKVACVAIILQNSQGEILLQQRQDSPEVPFAGLWTLPGGRVEPDEGPAQAAQRELTEETDLQVPLSLWKVYPRPGPQAQTIVQYVYTGRTNRPIESIPVLEGQALCYVRPEDLDRLPIAYGFDGLLKAFCYQTRRRP